MSNADPMAERFNDFREQESWLRGEIDAILDRVVDEAQMTRCQVAGVLMDISLAQLGRPFNERDDDEEKDDGESWRR